MQTTYNIQPHVILHNAVMLQLYLVPKVKLSDVSLKMYSWFLCPRQAIC